MKFVTAFMLLHAGTVVAADADLREHVYSEVGAWTSYSIHLDSHPVCIVLGVDHHTGFGFSSSDFQPQIAFTFSVPGYPMSPGDHFGVTVSVGVRQMAKAIVQATSADRIEGKAFWTQGPGHPPVSLGREFLHELRELALVSTPDYQKAFDALVIDVERDGTPTILVKPSDRGLDIALDGFEQCLTDNRVSLPP